MISTIIFDFAGVTAKERMFVAISRILSAKSGIPEKEIQERLYGNEAVYTRGEKPINEFWKSINIEGTLLFKDFTDAFRTWYVLNEEVLVLATTLKHHYQVVLFSENFDIASDAIKADPRVSSIFEKMYFSNEMHLSKRDLASFSYVLNDLGKNGTECVFIDDKETAEDIIQDIFFKFWINADEIIINKSLKSYL